MSKYNTRWKNGSGDYAPSPSPQPPSSPTLRERKGGDERSRGDSALASVNERYHVLRSPLSRSAGEGPGVRVALTFPPSPFLSPTGSGRGKVSVAVAILRLRRSTIPRPKPRSPLSRSAGEGPGVRAALTFPPAPFLSLTGSGRGRVA